MGLQPGGSNPRQGIGPRPGADSSWWLTPGWVLALDWPSPTPRLLATCWPTLTLTDSRHQAIWPHCLGWLSLTPLQGPCLTPEWTCTVSFERLIYLQVFSGLARSLPIRVDLEHSLTRAFSSYALERSSTPCIYPFFHYSSFRPHFCFILLYYLSWFITF